MIVTRHLPVVELVTSQRLTNGDDTTYSIYSLCSCLQVNDFLLVLFQLSVSPLCSYLQSFSLTKYLGGKYKLVCSPAGLLSAWSPLLIVPFL